MDKVEALKKARDFTKLTVDKLNPVKVFLYGSFANGNWHKYSDIDVAVVVKELEQDYMDTVFMLWKLRRDIDTMIEPKLFVVGQDPSGFLEYIEKYGELLYSAN